MSKTKSETNWDRVRAYKGNDYIPFEPGRRPLRPERRWRGAHLACASRPDSQRQGDSQRQARSAEGSDKEVDFAAPFGGSD